MVTSSAVVGSSAISRRGSQASAIAIITRWRMPPDSWCGYCAHAPLRLGDAHLAQHLDRARRSPRRCDEAAVQDQRSRRSAGRSVSTGIERGHRLLEDHRDLVAAHRRASRASVSASRSRPSKRIGPPTMRPGGDGDQPQDRQRRDALAAARLADDRQRLAGRDRERHAVDRAHDAVAREEMRLEVVDLEQRAAGRGCIGHIRRASRGSSASRRPSPSRLTASTVSDRKMPGNRIR